MLMFRLDGCRSAGAVDATGFINIKWWRFLPNVSVLIPDDLFNVCDDLCAAVLSLRIGHLCAGGRHQRDAHRECSPGYDDRDVYSARPARPLQILGVAETSHRGFSVQPSAARGTFHPQHRIRKGLVDTLCILPH